MRTWATLVVLTCCALPFARGQQSIQVDARTIQRHIDHQTFPVYPPIAKAAHVQGTVVFDLSIDAAGKVQTLQVVSGPAMLQQAAIDCLKQWTFHPFEKDGAPVVATGQYSLIFSLGDQSNTTVGHGPPSDVPGKVITVEVKSEDAANGPDEGLNRRFDEADDACKKGILARQFDDATVSACRDAGTLAEKLPAEDNYVGKRSAFVYAATAYADVGDFKGALLWAEKAVAVVKLGHDDDSGSSAAYSTKGTVEALLGSLSEADQDLTAAEDFSRKGIARAQSDAAPAYVRPFLRDLKTHANVLEALGRTEEAQKKLNEAAKYDK